MTTILVTGASGFIGKHLVRRLLDSGNEVRCLMRQPREFLPGVVPHGGDILQPDTLDQPLRGVDVVYHLAGATMVTHPAQYRRVNDQGTHHLAEACVRQSRPPRLLYLSSLAAGGPALSDRPRKESDPPAPVSLYGKSKAAGERTLARLADRLSSTIVRAPGVYGPGDPNNIRLFRAASMGLNGVPGALRLQVPLIHVDDLVRGMILAVSRGKSLTSDLAQGVYNLAHPRQPTLEELGTLAGEAMGNPRVRTFSLPRAFCRFWGRVIDLVVAVSGHPRLLTSDKMREVLAGSWACSTDRATEELGFACEVSFTEGFASTVKWYRDNGWL
ncbi:MAG: NAD-dependent epimerase/dehydratase family protein [Gemmataceae bacterium]